MSNLKDLIIGSAMFVAGVATTYVSVDSLPKYETWKNELTCAKATVDSLSQEVSSLDRNPYLAQMPMINTPYDSLGYAKKTLANAREQYQSIQNDKPDVNPNKTLGMGAFLCILGSLVVYETKNSSED